MSDSIKRNENIYFINRAFKLTIIDTDKRDYGNQYVAY